jgi:dihydroneopterin aldolase
MLCLSRHLPEERRIGAHYRVSVEVEAAIEKAGKTDQIDDTLRLSYSIWYCVQEMKKSSALLEHVASRILDKIMLASSTILWRRLKLPNDPPLGGNVHEYR